MQIMESGVFKLVQSPTYNYVFNKKNGFTATWGRTLQEDPAYSPFGPMILDLEISSGKCGGNCRFCSPAGSMVGTPNGEVPIENLQLGDCVIGYDCVENRIQLQDIIDVYTREYKGCLICIELENGRVLKLTPDHLVYVKNRGFMEAKNLENDFEILYF
jgi:hypothetical protein